MVEKSRACTSGSLAALDDTTTPMSRDASPRSRDASSRAVPTAVSLEDDMRLVDLSTQAARSLHRLRGFEYDESYQISIADDIVFAVVDLVAPFGIIFQENPVGCWVTKVLPQGSAARSNKVQVGDQLAAIDGMSAINMKVDEMSALVTQKKGVVELTFLRFVGPLRPAPGPIQEEGYEVKSQKGTQPSLTRYAQPISQGKAAFVSSQRPEAPASPKERRGFRLFKLGRSRKYNL
jgi:C-terminal processing protease CtpA/Prc